MKNNCNQINESTSNYTYQHIQGCLLLGLNKLASDLKLSHSEYRIMATLIGYYNKNHGKAYPTTRQLVKDCCMSNTTLSKGLNRLNDLGLIITVKDSQFRRQQYHINKQKFLNISSNNNATHVKTASATPCKSTHDIKLIDNKINKKNISFKTNDANFKTTNISEYREILNKLDTWRYSGAKKLLKQKGIKEIKKLIDLVENHNPKNKGAYLRSLLVLPDINYSSQIKSSPLTLERTQIEQIRNKAIVETKKLINSYKNIKTSSPLDFSRQEAITYLNNLPKNLLKTPMNIKLIKKHNLERILIN